ncbi:hypothetical protein BC1G_12372 [Paecilomyces variotii No. 5]|uniref:Xylanolytic transcriptional activator regulatory domain-containing protein n=1 Tax=Byssochlamys spectabilis (strain No. 5 / NBRC 109023) TaxID=1356009 RepID=V5GEM6_BYSSN|nr:hypothetical protein BC1G_12372 [Paecilomyces variotii No. 5]
MYDASKDSEVPRSYVADLEEKCRQLSREAEQLRSGSRRGSSDTTISSPSSCESDVNVQVYQLLVDARGGLPDREQRLRSVTSRKPSYDLVASMARVAFGGSRGSQFMGSSSGIALANLVMDAVQDLLPSSSGLQEMQSSEAIAAVPVKPASLPPRHAADHIVSLYFRDRGPHFVFLDRRAVEESFDYVYSSNLCPSQIDERRTKQHLFLVFMVLAIGLCSILAANNTRPVQCQGCFSSALGYLDAVLGYSQSDLDSLTAILLISQYVTLYPAQGSLWQLTGIALRLCIDMGLHWEGNTIVGRDPREIDTQRRYFWTIYKLDRLLSITLGRPYGITDNSIKVGYPIDYAELSRDEQCLPCGEKVTSNHLTRIYELESEIKQVLYHRWKAPSLAYPEPDYTKWRPHMNQRLKEWYASIPKPEEVDSGEKLPSQAWWEALYSNALLLLHRPSPVTPHPTLESFEICATASKIQIQSIKSLHRSGKIDIVWIWVQRLFLAGLMLMHCVWYSKEIRQKLSLSDLMETTQSCSSVLAALAERFPGAVSCRDNFERISTATMQLFSATSKSPRLASVPLVSMLRTDSNMASQGRDHARGDRPEYFTCDEDVGWVLSSGAPQFGEMLNRAAQWPDDGMAAEWESMFEGQNE